MNTNNNNEEVYKYDTDINQIMNIIINSLYSNNDIFIRELISNAHDALEKKRYNCLQDQFFIDKNEFKIKIYMNKDSNTLYIEDNGIGMDKQELIENLGTIAKSGTKNFLKELKNNPDKNKLINQIGQFGVGFYSVFLVANSINVISKKNKQIFKWSSTNNEDKNFTITNILDDKFNYDSGTIIELNLNEESIKYLDESYLKNIITKYSNFTKYNIELSNNLNDEFKNINECQPLWTRSNKDIEYIEYDKLYSTVINTNGSKFITHKHIVVEGNIEYNCILYIPDKVSISVFDDLNKIKNIKLYVNNIYITDESLLPNWLGFIVGVINCNNLPLNVSRELLQQNEILERIKKSVLKKTLEFLYDLLKNDKQKYEQIYDLYCKFIKLGIYNDHNTNNELSKLLLYKHLNNSDEYISLNDYKENSNKNNMGEIEKLLEECKEMTKLNKEETINKEEETLKEKVNKIYYMFGENIDYILNSPNIEFAKKNNLDVLLITDTIDDYLFKIMDDNKNLIFISFN
jgi:molecular chaperone HtpG